MSDTLIPLGGAYQLALDIETDRLVVVDGAGAEVASFPIVLAGAEIAVATVSALLASDGDVEVGVTEHGLVLTAPNGSRWRMTIGNGGTPSWTEI